MSSAVLLQSEDQFLCSLCLDVLTRPVTLQCGHNFCNECIAEHWKTKAQYDCPACKQVFQPKPQLKVNTLLSVMVAQFRHEAEQKTSSSSSEQAIRLGLTVTLTLILTLTSVYMLWPVLDHKDHRFAPLNEEYEEKKLELMETEAELQQRIQERRVRLEEIKHSVKMSKYDADREKAQGLQIFTALKESVDRSLKELMKDVEERQTKAVAEAKDIITELEQEISELMKRSADVGRVSLSEDHLQLIQSFPSLKVPPPTKDWTEVRVCPPSYEGTVARAVAQLQGNLRKKAQPLMEAEVKRVQQFAVDVTVDPDTAHANLALSDDGKQVYHSSKKSNIPDNPQRFSPCVCALGKQSFSTGRFYFEVQVKGKTDWDLGVARSSINRKGQITTSPENGYWTIMLRNGTEYSAVGRLSPMSQPEKVGVFVDYEGGLVSFYDVNAATLIYSFTGCSFTEKIHPLFSPSLNNGGKNFDPLIIM